MNVRFAEFRLDSGTRQLFRADQEVHLSPKAFELLCALVEARPNALSKTALTERLWPSTFVSEANLAVLAAEVRAALGDDASQPRFVRTVHRFGYAFSALATEAAHSQLPGLPGRWLITESARIELPAGASVIGRDPHATIWLDLPSVSRQHARLTVDGQSVTLEDLGSRNGTFLHGERVTGPVALRDGDSIRLGSVVVQFRESTGGEVTEEVEPSGGVSS